MAKEAENKESAQSASSAVPESSSNNPSDKKAPKKVSFDEFADEVPAKRPPLAPESTVESSSSAIPEKSAKLSSDQEFQERHLPENDFMMASDDKPIEKEAKSSDEGSSATIDSWAEEPDSVGGWELDDIDVAASNSSEDVFGSMAEEQLQKEQEAPAAQVETKPGKNEDPLPPWQQGAVSGQSPELPSGTTFNQSQEKPTDGLSPAEVAAKGAASLVAHEKAKPVGALVGILLLVGIGFAGYSFFVEKDETTEVISRWTGSLNEVSEEIPTASENLDTPQASPSLQPESVVDMASIGQPKQTETPEYQPEEEMGDLMVAEEPEEQAMEDEIAPEMPQQEQVEVAMNETESAGTVVEFVDVPEDEVEKPIDAEGAPEMPEEVGVIVQLQQAIAEARQEKNPDDFKPSEEVVEEVENFEENLEMLTPAEIDARNRELSRQLEEELAEYRKILAGESTESQDYKPSPNEFFAEKEVEGAIEGESGSIPLPERKSALLSQKQAESLYGSNPYNLPVVPEPTYTEDTGVRTLEDFDVSMFQVERERVRIPKNVRPSFRATNFPPLILLSTVPKKGIIAELNSKQGVLLIGESVSGWELLNVKQEYAEFTNGKRKHIVSIGR